MKGVIPIRPSKVAEIRALVKLAYESMLLRRLPDGRHTLSALGFEHVRQEEIRREVYWRDGCYRPLTEFWSTIIHVDQATIPTLGPGSSDPQPKKGDSSCQ